MDTLSIDIETRSKEKLVVKDGGGGLYRYIHDPDFEILLFGYKLNKQPWYVVDLANGEEVPIDIMRRLTDPNTIKKAFNAAFEFLSIERFFLLKLDLRQWRCTMVRSAMLGLPMSLEGVGEALNIDTKKEMIGKSLIRFFTIPCKPTKDNGMQTWNTKKYFPEKWEQFKHYCGVDVEAEDQIADQIDFYQPTAGEFELWILDQNINSYGIGVDPKLIEHATQIDMRFRNELLTEARDITKLDNPNSTQQLIQWLNLEIDERVTTLRKEAVHDLIKHIDDKTVKRVLRIRQMLSRSSVKKYHTAKRMIGINDRIRGVLQYYGANRTGRWAGRGIQPHNYPPNKMKELDLARQIVLAGDYDLLKALFEDIPDALSQLLRTMFIAGEDKELIMADFSAIEARVIAWLAGEEWRLNIFRGDGKIYEMSASKVFKKPISECGPDTIWRAMGKVYELALGFQGSVGAVRRMDSAGALKDIPDSRIQADVNAWRAESPHIKAMWNEVQDAAINAVMTGQPQRCCGGRVRYFMKRQWLFCELPSGRCLSYFKPQVKPGEYGPALYYIGIDQTTQQWKLIPTYGGKLVENIVQAVARDLLAEKMLVLAKLKFRIVFHVHDEIVVEVPKYRDPYITDMVGLVKRTMAEPILWAKGLPLACSVYSSPYYKKD